MDFKGLWQDIYLYFLQLCRLRETLPAKLWLSVRAECKEVMASNKADSSIEKRNNTWEDSVTVLLVSCSREFTQAPHSQTVN